VGAYNLLRDGLYFTGTIDGIKRRSAAEITAEKEKREEKGREAAEREAFLSKLKNSPPFFLRNNVLSRTSRHWPTENR